MDITEKFDRLLIVLVMFGIALYYWGISSNATVIIANDNSMPVLGVETSMELADNDGKPRHVGAEGRVVLPFLADRIWIDFPDVHIGWKPFRKIVNLWAEALAYPLDRGTYIASAGDIMMWSGSALFLLLLPVLFIRIPFRLAHDGIRFER